jgi:hypothetical protein
MAASTTIPKTATGEHRSRWLSPFKGLSEVVAVPQILRVTDDTTLEELAEALSTLNAFARRQQHIIGGREGLSAWDRAHQRIDKLLTDWQAKAPCA